MAKNNLVMPGVQQNTATPEKQGTTRPTAEAALREYQSGNKTGAQDIANQAVGLGGSSGGKSAMGSPTNPSGGGSAMTGGGSAAQDPYNQPQFKNIKSTENLYDSDGNVALRQGLVNRNIDTSRIGWDDEKGVVTIDGIGVTNAGYEKDGTAYGNEAALNRLTDQAYRQMGDELVGAASYASQAGIGNLVKWDESSQTVQIGGTTLNPVYVSGDGIAYVRKSEIDKALASTKEGAGVRDNQDVYKDWENKYGTRIDAALDALRDYSYDPNKDKEYQAYAAYQMQQKYKLAQDAAARAMDLNGGYGAPNIGAISSSLYNSQQDIAAAIPQYAEQYYNRLRNNLSDTITAGQESYNKAYQANRDAYNDYQAALDKDYQRIQDERAWSETQADRRQTEIENKSTNYRNAIDDEFYRESKELQLAYDRATVRGQNISNDLSQVNLDTQRLAALNTLARTMNGYPAWDTVSGAIGITAYGEDGQEKFIPLKDMGYTGFPAHPYTEEYNQNYYSTLGTGRANAELAYEAMERGY